MGRQGSDRARRSGPFFVARTLQREHDPRTLFTLELDDFDATIVVCLGEERTRDAFERVCRYDQMPP